jgi:hypothetical protein
MTQVTLNVLLSFSFEVGKSVILLPALLSRSALLA